MWGAACRCSTALAKTPAVRGFGLCTRVAAVHCARPVWCCAVARLPFREDVQRAHCISRCAAHAGRLGAQALPLRHPARLGLPGKVANLHPRIRAKIGRSGAETFLRAQTLSRCPIEARTCETNRPREGVRREAACRAARPERQGQRRGPRAGIFASEREGQALRHPDRPPALLRIGVQLRCVVIDHLLRFFRRAGCSTSADFDFPRLHRLRNLPRKLNLEQAVLERCSLDLDMILEVELPLE